MGCGGNCACAQRAADAEAQVAAVEGAVQPEEQSEEKDCCKANPEKVCACKNA